jgi:hypothetical protein
MIANLPDMKFAIAISSFLFIVISVQSQKARTFLMDPDRIASIKKKYEQKDPTTVSLVNELTKEADKQLDMKPVSVMDKEISPPSGNKHDYMSQAPYFWYDSSKPNGLPYIRRDGQRNPEIYKITDRTYMGNLDNAARTLALAFYITGDEKYAAKTAILLRHWFLDGESKMNPNLEYGQGIPGINTGRGIGIIETVSLTGIVDAIGLLANSKSWSGNDQKGLQDWYAKYLDWLLNSKYGKDEAAAKNNHGTWYNVQVVDFALFTGDKQKARQLAEDAKKRIDSQIGGDGKMQLELDRTNGLGYSSMNLKGWFDMATLADELGVDLWKYTNKENAGIKTALDWLAPYALGDKPWIFEQITPYNKNQIYSTLLRAANEYKDPKYAEYANRIDADVNEVMTDLLYKK